MTKNHAGTRIEKADRKASHRLNNERDSWPMRVIGAASEVPRGTHFIGDVLAVP